MRRSGSDIDGNPAKKPSRRLRSSSDVHDATFAYERTPLHLALLKQRSYKSYLECKSKFGRILGWPSLVPLEYGGRDSSILHQNYIMTDALVDVQKVKKLIRAGANVNAVDLKDNTCLHYAVENEDCCELISLLVDAGAQLDFANNIGDTPLLTAVKVNNLGAVDTLIQRGANVKLSNNSGETCLHLARSDAILYLLLNSGGSTQINSISQCGCSPILVVIDYCNRNTLTQAIQAGADVNFKHKGCEVQDCRRSLKSPLREAIEKKQDELVEVLLEHGAKPNEICNENRSILWHASQFGFCPPRYYQSVKLSSDDEEDVKYANIVQLMITHGADVCNDVESFKAVIKHGSLRAIHLFLNEYRRKKVQIPLQQSLLHLAVHNPRDDVFHFFLRSNFHGLDQADEEGYTAFHRAIQVPFRRRAKSLLDFGADINTVNNAGKTVLDTALSLYSDSRTQLVQFLLSYGSLPLWRIDMTNLDSRRLYITIQWTNYLDRAKEIIKYIALNESVGNRLAPAVSKHLAQTLEYSYRKLYFNCVIEIQLLRSSIIYGSTTAYDFLTTLDDRYIRNENLVRELSSGDFYERFPLYANLIRHRFAQLQEELDRFLKSGRGLSRILGLDYSTFHLIYENILRRLSPIDHLNLCRI